MPSIIDSYSETNADTNASMPSDQKGFGQCFTGNGSKITEVKWYLGKTGTPTGNVVSKIWTMTGTFGTNGNVGTLLATSDNVDPATFSATHALATFPFSGAEQYTTVNGTHYVVSVQYSGSGGTVLVWYDNTTGTHPGTWVYTSDNVTWTPLDLGFDFCFYVEGSASVIVNLTGVAFSPAVGALGFAAGFTFSGAAPMTDIGTGKVHIEGAAATVTPTVIGMDRILEHSIMVTDFDFNNLDLLNSGVWLPVPDGLVGIDDPRLSDQRPVADGTVRDISVSPTAAIAQSKLDFDGDMPAAWIGTGVNQAAEGDLYQPVAQKGVANGYVPLDSTGKIPAEFVPTGAGTGTVTMVDLTLPASEFDVSPSSIIDSGTFAITWKNEANNSWLGVVAQTPYGLTPRFLTSAVPGSVVPDLDAAKITSGVFSAARLPVFHGLGVGHAIGAVPDPGTGTHVDDYLGRDTSWRSVHGDVPYQPQCPSPAITFLYYDLPPVHGHVRIYVPSLPTAHVFVSFHDPADPTPPVYHEIPNDSGSDYAVLIGFTVFSYAARDGYNNSEISSFTIPPH